MPHHRITINSLSYDLSIRKSWECELTLSTSELIKAFGVFDRNIEHKELGLIEIGTRSVETYFLERWFNHFHFFRPDGSLRNHYFNICMPPSLNGSVLSYVDLDIDVVVWPDRTVTVLDLEDFNRTEIELGYPPEIRGAAFKTLYGLLEVGIERIISTV